jgi:hypothetical protein
LRCARALTSRKRPTRPRRWCSHAARPGPSHVAASAGWPTPRPADRAGLRDLPLLGHVLAEGREGRPAALEYRLPGPEMFDQRRARLLRSWPCDPGHRLRSALPQGARRHRRCQPPSPRPSSPDRRPPTVVRDGASIWAGAHPPALGVSKAAAASRCSTRARARTGGVPSRSGSRRPRLARQHSEQPDAGGRQVHRNAVELDERRRRGYGGQPIYCICSCSGPTCAVGCRCHLAVTPFGRPSAAPTGSAA